VRCDKSQRNGGGGRVREIRRRRTNGDLLYGNKRVVCYEGIRPGEAFPQVKVGGGGNGKGCGDDADRVKYAGGG